MTGTKYASARGQQGHCPRFGKGRKRRNSATAVRAPERIKGAGPNLTSQILTNYLKNNREGGKGVSLRTSRDWTHPLHGEGGQQMLKPSSGPAINKKTAKGGKDFPA